MVAKDFYNAQDITKTRAAMGLRLGEIISAIIGDNRIKELFGRDGKHPDEYAGQSTGEMALKLNVITPDTKTALLVAQAAERTFELAKKAGMYAQKHQAFVDYYKKINERVHPSLREYVDEKWAGVVEYGDPVFKFVGSERDPEMLKTAQATWMAAQIYMNHEIRSIKDDVTAGGFLGRQQTMGAEYADGFKKAAAGFYAQAARLLAKEGHAEAAAKLKAVSKAMLKHGVDNKTAPIPSRFVSRLLHQEQYGLQQANIVLGDEKWSLPKEYEDTLQKLIKLTMPPAP